VVTQSTPIESPTEPGKSTMPRRLFFTTATAFLGAWMMGGTAQAASALVLTVKSFGHTDPPCVVTVDNLTIPVFNDEGM